MQQRQTNQLQNYGINQRMSVSNTAVPPNQQANNVVMTTFGEGQESKAQQPSPRHAQATDTSLEHSCR